MMRRMSRQVRDHLGRRIDLAGRPQRIVSLCPSLTETLFALGLGGRIVGRTSYCVHPADVVTTLPVVGGTKTLSIETIAALAPDLIIAAKEENDRAQVESLMERHPVFVVDVNDFDEALRAVRDVGEVTGARESAAGLVKRINLAFEDLSPLEPAVDVVYLVWGDPPMAAGRGTYIDALLQRCGLRNVCANLEGRYPKVGVEQIATLAPQAVLLSSEPFPFTEAHVAEWGEKIPAATIFLVDGEMFAWYGARMIDAGPYLAAILRRLSSWSRDDTDSSR